MWINGLSTVDWSFECGRASNLLRAQIEQRAKEGRVHLPFLLFVLPDCLSWNILSLLCAGICKISSVGSQPLDSVFRLRFLLSWFFSLQMMGFFSFYNPMSQIFAMNVCMCMYICIYIIPVSLENCNWYARTGLNSAFQRLLSIADFHICFILGWGSLSVFISLR